MSLIDIMTPEFWSLNTLQQMYKNSVMIALVNRDFENEVRSKGDTVNTRIPGYVATREVNLSNPFSAQEQGAQNVEIKLSKWIETIPMKIDDKTRSLGITDLIRLYIEPAAQGMLEAVETDVTALYKDLSAYVGAAGTTPADVAAFGTNLKQKFDDLRIDRTQRRVVLNTTTSNSFGQRMWRANEVGSTAVLQSGLQGVASSLGVFFGSNYFDSQYLGQHKAGNLGSAVSVGSTAAGSFAIAITGGGAHAVIGHGDLFTINHGGSVGTVSYNVAVDVELDANGAGTLILSNAIAATVANATALTAVGDHAVNLCFHRDAFTLATRPLEMPIGTGALVSVSDFGGIGVRSTLWYEPKDRCHYASMDMLYGLKTIDARRAFRLIG
jgi:P22 coat protein - gene protein 5